MKKVDWWLIVQPDSARLNWLGCDPVLAPWPLIFFLFYSYIFPSPLPIFHYYSCLFGTHSVRHTVHKYLCVQAVNTSPACFSSRPPPPLVLCCTKLIIVAIIHSWLFPFFLSSFLCPLCFLSHRSFRTGFMAWFISSVSFYNIYSYSLKRTGYSEESLIGMSTKLLNSIKFRVTNYSKTSANIPLQTTVQQIPGDQVCLNTRHASFKCGSSCFFFHWFPASLLHTTIVIYGNYPSKGSSINWLLLGDGSSCCLVGGSSTVRGSAGEFKRWHPWRKVENLLFC